MFKTIRMWFERCRRRNARAIFRYWDGSAFRFGDPIDLYNRIVGHDKFVLEKEFFALASAGHEPERSGLLTAITEVFDLQPFDDKTGAGLTEEEITLTLDELLTYIDKLKKKRKVGATWLPPTEPESSNTQEPPAETTS